ncbi:MAG: hypothetical protein O2877_01085 [bacterium]|nr:hypothetical protein [bacterium]
MFWPIDFFHGHSYWWALINGAKLQGSDVWWCKGIFPVMLFGSVVLTVCAAFFKKKDS